MTKTILSFFSNNGSPATGLSATLKIYDLADNTLVIEDESMTEVGDGFYEYSFSDYDESKDYAILADGGATLDDFERYVYAGNESYVEDIWNISSGKFTKPSSMADMLRSSGGAVISGEGGKITEAQAEDIAKKVWEVLLDKEQKAKDVLLTRSDFNAAKDEVIVRGWNEVLDSIVENNKNIEQVIKLSTDLSTDLSTSYKQFDKVNKNITLNNKEIDKKLATLVTNIEKAVADINNLDKDTINNFEKTLMKGKSAITEMEAKVKSVQISDLKIDEFNDKLKAVNTFKELVGNMRDQLNNLLVDIQAKDEKRWDKMMDIMKTALMQISNQKFDLLTRRRR